MTYVGLCYRSQEEITDVSRAFRVLDDSAQMLRVLLDFRRPCEWSTGVRSDSKRDVRKVRKM